MLSVGAKDNEKTNIRVNEVYLSARVDYDAEVEKASKGSENIRSSEFAKVYEQILAKPELKGNRLTVRGKKDLEDFTVERLFKGWHGSG